MVSLEKKNALKADDSPISGDRDDEENLNMDPKAEKGLVTKLDLCIYPTLFIYVFSRSHQPQQCTNPGKVGGSQPFIPYILLEISSNVLIRKIRPSFYLSGLAFLWGIINMCMGYVYSYAALVALRFLLSSFEVSVLPGILYVTSIYYNRHQFQKRMHFFFCSTIFSVAFGGLLAYAIAKMGGTACISARTWIFIIEGVATAVLAFVLVFLVIDWPSQTKFLDAEERLLLQRRLAADIGDADACRMDTPNKFAYIRILRDWKIWIGSLVYLGIGTTGYAGVFFMLDYPSRVWLASATGSSVDYPSLRLGRRCHADGSLGFTMLLVQHDKSREYKFAAVFLINGGGYMATPMALAWLQNNLSGHWKRSFGASIQIALGNFAGIIESNVFSKGESPYYPTGYGTALGMLWVSTVAATAMFLLMRRENKKRDAGEREERISLAGEQNGNMGDWHPSFRFTL